MATRPQRVPPLSGIAATSLGVAWLRAIDTERAERLFDDPYARRFVAADTTALRHHPRAIGISTR
jgi:O-methyltransferase involved in polyketide biosynthesis